MIRHRGKSIRSGFTFVEVLVATAVMAIGISAGLRALGAMAAASGAAADHTAAVHVAAKRLALLEAAVDAQQGTLETATTGAVDLASEEGQDTADPRFRWQQEVTPAQADSTLYQVTVTVTWNSGVMQRHYAVTTYLPNLSAQTSATTSTAAGG